MADMHTIADVCRLKNCTYSGVYAAIRRVGIAKKGERYQFTDEELNILLAAMTGHDSKRIGKPNKQRGLPRVKKIKSKGRGWDHHKSIRRTATLSPRGTNI